MDDFIPFFLILFFFFLLFWWAFKTLPQERWQILATLPVQKGEETKWTGLNLTYYGVFTACSVTFSVWMFAILESSHGVTTVIIFEHMFILLGLTVPSAKIVARLVEKKPSTFTIGGASFVGMMAAPLVILILNAVHPDHWPRIPMVPSMAALWIAFAFGEGLGRLACISFGCCYGKPLSHCRPMYQRMFRQWHFRFSGKTKKAVYESGLDSVPLIPIQGLTALLNVGVGFFGLGYFLSGNYLLTICLVGGLTQLWRVISEELRADYRGGKNFTPYQFMAMIGAGYTMLWAFFWPNSSSQPPDILQGVLSIWTPEGILFLQGLWFVIFLFTGCSRVTGATMSFHVQQEKI